MKLTLALIAFYSVSAFGNYQKVTAFDMSPKEVFVHKKISVPDDLFSSNLEEYGPEAIGSTRGILPAKYSLQVSLWEKGQNRSIIDSVHLRYKILYNDYQDDLFTQPSLNVDLPEDSIPARLSFDLESIISTQKLFELNLLAAKTWSNFVEKCASNDPNKAIEKYRDRKICSKFRDELKEYRQRIFNFLADGTFSGYNYTDQWQCLSEHSVSTVDEKNCGEFIRFSDIKQNITDIYQASYRPPADPEQKVHILSQQIFDRMDLPKVHPYFVQTLLEVVTIGYPFLYAGNRESAVSLLTKKLLRQSRNNLRREVQYSRYNQSSPDREKTPGPLSEWHNKLIQTAEEYFENGEIPSLADQLKMQAESNNGITRNWLPKLNLFLASAKAEKLLHIISLIEQDFTQWGIWPDASLILVNVLAQSIIQTGPDETLSTNVRSRLTLLPEYMGQSNFLYAKKFTIRPGENGEAELKQLYSVGAWRKLWYLK